MKKTISLFSLFMLLATNFMPLVSFANEPWETVENVDDILTDIWEINGNLSVKPVDETLIEKGDDLTEGQLEKPVVTPTDEVIDGENTEVKDIQDAVSTDNQPAITEENNVELPQTDSISNPITESGDEEPEEITQITNSVLGGTRTISSENSCFEIEGSSIKRFNYEVENCFNWILEIPSDITSIWDSAWPYTVGKTDEEKEINEKIDKVKKWITEVRLPNNLTYIWEWAFQRLINMTTINFPSSLTGIWAWAFQSTAITSADISMIDVIENWVFNSTEQLTEVKFSDSLRKIGDNAFQKSAAEMVINSENIQYVWPWAFTDSNLKYINLKNLTSISQWAFAWSKLSGVEFNDKLTTIEDMAFQNLKSETLGNVTLKNIQHIWQQAFLWTKMWDVNINWTDDSDIALLAFKWAHMSWLNISNIKNIGQQSFEQAAMSGLVITWSDDSKISMMAFSNLQSTLSKIKITNVSEIGQQSFQNLWRVGDIEITGPISWTVIGNQAFTNAKSWNTILTNVAKVEQQAFQNNSIWWYLGIQWTWSESLLDARSFWESSIWNISINNISTLWDDVFTNVSWVHTVFVNWWWPATSIWPRAFYNLSFTGEDWKVELNNVKTLWDQSFYNVKNLNTVVITGANDWITIEPRAFQNGEFVSLKLTNGKEVKHQAFFNISGLELADVNWYEGWAIIWDQVFEASPKAPIEGKETVINIWDKVTYIWVWAFQDSKATSINIEWATWNNSCETDSSKNCGTAVEERALQWTTSLKNATFWTWVTKVWDHQFVGSTVETVVIEWSEKYGTTIGKNAFQATQRQADGLGTVKSVTLWEWVTELGEYAFMNTRITEITIPSTVDVIPEYSFVWVKTLTGVTISEGVEVIWKWAFVGTSLKSVYIGGSEEWTQIQENAFLNIKTLNSLEIDWWVSYIGKQAFQWTAITDVNIKGSKNWCTIDNWAFRNADSIQTIHLWTWVTNVEKQAFELLDNVTSIIIDWAPEWTVIWEQAFHHANNLQSVQLGSVSRIDFQAFAIAWKLSSINITGPAAPADGTVIWDQAFLWNALTSLTLGNIKEIWNAAFAKTTNKDAYTVISETLALMWENAFSYTDSVNVVIEADISSLTEAQIAELKAKKVNVIQGYRINFMNEWNLYYSALFAKWSDYVLPYTPYKTWYELEWWTEDWVDSLFHFDGNKINSNKTFTAKWKSIQEKVAETNKEESVVFLKHTNVTIYGAAENVNIEDSTDTIQLKSNNDVKQSSIFVDTGWNSTINQELDVDVSKTVEYQGWVEVYFEVKKDNKTEVVNETAKFSVPIAVKVPVSNANAEYVKVKVKHEGDENYGYKWLTLNSENYCEMWEAVEDRYNWEGVKVVNNNGERYATIYTCSASTFVAYTEDSIVIPTPSAWGGRTIVSTPTTTEKEHNSADINEQTENTKTNEKTTNQIELNEKLLSMKLTRWEVAVMTNILLDVFPQLVEGKQELNDVENACSNYADAQKFTKSEKKAITRLCKLSIMGIHAETKKPLDEFLVKQLAKNNEFATVINRSILSYNEKDLTVVKDALKKLENNEDAVEFGTLYNVFMSVKNLLN